MFPLEYRERDEIREDAKGGWGEILGSKRKRERKRWRETSRRAFQRERKKRGKQVRMLNQIEVPPTLSKTTLNLTLVNYLRFEVLQAEK